MRQRWVRRPLGPAEPRFAPWCMCGSWRRGQGVRESSSPGWAMALPAREGDVPGLREESLEVHPAGEEFFPAVAVLLMDRPRTGLAACAPSGSRGHHPPWPWRAREEWAPQRDRARHGGARGDSARPLLHPAQLCGGKGGAGAVWLPRESLAKLARSSLHLLLKGGRWVAEGGSLFGHLQRQLKVCSHRHGSQSAGYQWSMSWLHRAGIMLQM